MIDPYTDPAPEHPAATVERTDFTSLTAAPPEPSDLPELHRFTRTDYASLSADLPPERRVMVNWGPADYFVDFITPFLIFMLVSAVLAYLLNVRYVYTAVHDPFLRIFAFSFMMGIVALNRLIARHGSYESMLYIGGLAGAVFLYTLATTELYGMGSVMRNFMNQNAWAAAFFNLAVVIFLWWVVNRLTHECCVDENAVAGDIGIFTATAEKMRDRLRRAAAAPPDVKRYEAVSVSTPWYGIQAVDPLERAVSRKAEQVRSDFTERLPKRHPGMALFYFSVPIIIIFTIGLRVIQHLGEGALRMGAFYLYVYTFCALMLLSLTCLRQLRAYFSLRSVSMPGMASLFWVGVSLLMTVMIMWGAAQFPMPEIPPPLHVDYHERDVYMPRARHVELLDVTPPTVSYLDSIRFAERLDVFARVVVVMILLYSLIKGLQYLVDVSLHKRDRLPRIINIMITGLAWLLFRLFPALLRWTFPKRRLRIQRQVALSVHYDNPRGRPDRGAAMTVSDHVAYAYEALCALATDVGAPRKASETPFDFLARFPERLSSIRDEAETLIRLYTITAYSPQEVDEKVEDKLRAFWYAYRQTRNFYIY